MHARSDLEVQIPAHPFRDFRQVVLDNYVPYVSRVQIYQGNCELRYDTDLESPVSLPLLPGLAIIVLTFSETICDDDLECEATAVPKAEIVDIVGPFSGTFGMNQVTNDTWTVEFEIPPGLSGEASIRVYDLFDTAGNPQANSETSALEAIFDPQTDEWEYDTGSQEFIVSFESNFGMQVLDQTWARSYGGGAYDKARSIKSLIDGGYVLAGTTSSFQSDESDVWVLKLDNAGVIEWEKRFNGGDGSSDEGNAVIQTSEGGFLVLASARNVGEDLNERFWLLKLDATGEIDWQRFYGPWGLAPFPNTLTQTLDEGYVVAGQAAYAFSEDSGSDALVMKLDNLGNIQWRNIYGWDVSTKQDEFSSIRPTADGGYIVGGYTSSVSGDQFNLWVLKLTSSGSVEWQNIYDDGDGLADYVTSVDQTLDGGFIVAGMLDQQNTTIPIILKLTSTGAIDWKRSYDHNYDGFQVIRSTPDGGAIVAGGTNCDTTCTSWILKLDNLGEIEWQRTFGSVYSAAVSLDQTVDSNYAVAAASYDDFFAFTLDTDGNSCALLYETSVTPGIPGITVSSTGASSMAYQLDNPASTSVGVATNAIDLNQCGFSCSGLTSMYKLNKVDVSKDQKQILRNHLRPPHRLWSKRKSKIVNLDKKVKNSDDSQ